MRKSGWEAPTYPSFDFRPSGEKSLVLSLKRASARTPRARRSGTEPGRWVDLASLKASRSRMYALGRAGRPRSRHFPAKRWPKTKLKPFIRLPVAHLFSEPAQRQWRLLRLQHARHARARRAFCARVCSARAFRRCVVTGGKRSLSAGLGVLPVPVLYIKSVTEKKKKKNRLRDIASVLYRDRSCGVLGVEMKTLPVNRH